MTAKIVYDACLRLSNIHILEDIVQLGLKRFLWNERSQLRTSHSWLLDWLIYSFIDWCLIPNEQYFSHIHYKNKSTNNKLLSEWSIACMLRFPCNGPRATTPKRLLFIKSKECVSFPIHGTSYKDELLIWVTAATSGNPFQRSCNPQWRNLTSYFNTPCFPRESLINYINVHNTKLI
jgi:hypothetical protein